MSTHTREALDAVGGAPFVQKIIDPMLLEYQRRYSPLVRAIVSKKHNSDVYYFNQRDRVPAGGNVRDGGARPLSSSVYDQRLFRMKHFQTVGDVTGYAEEVTAAQVGSLRGLEIEGGIRGLYWDLETQISWGCAGATEFGPYPQFDGFDNLLSSYSGSAQNAIDSAGGTLTTGRLDQLIDMVETNAAEAVQDAQWMLVMSPTAQSRIAQLLADQQRFERVNIAAGLNVMTYRDIPIVKSSFLSNRAITVAPVTSATATTGGTLPAATYLYRVSAIIARSGETVASAEVSQITTGATSTVTLSLPTVTGLDGAEPLLFKVYRTSGASGTGTLLGIVDAVVRLAGDGVTPIPTTSITDTGTALVPKNATLAPAGPVVLPTAYFGTNAAKKPPAAGHESVFLVSRDERNLVRPYVRELAPLDLAATVQSPDSQPYAVMSDTTLALRAPKYLGALTGNAVALTA